MEVCFRNVVVELACRTLQAGCGFPGCAGGRISPSRTCADPALFSPSSTSTSELPVSFSDPEPLPSTHPSILSAASGSIVESDADQRVRSPTANAGSSFGRTLAARGATDLFRTIPQAAFKVDLPVPPLPEPVELARESEPVSSPSVMAPEPVALSRKPPLRSLHVQR